VDCSRGKRHWSATLTNSIAIRAEETYHPMTSSRARKLTAYEAVDAFGIHDVICVHEAMGAVAAQHPTLDAPLVVQIRPTEHVTGLSAEQSESEVDSIRRISILMSWSTKPQVRGSARLCRLRSRFRSGFGGDVGIGAASIAPRPIAPMTSPVGAATGSTIAHPLVMPDAAASSRSVARGGIVLAPIQRLLGTGKGRRRSSKSLQSRTARSH